MADADPRAPKPPSPLQTSSVEWHGDDAAALLIRFNRPLTGDEFRDYIDLPPTPVMRDDTRTFAERVILAELVVRIFRAQVLSGIVTAETPRVMAWLKDWIDGTDKHGPIGNALLWPDHLPGLAAQLTHWGFIRSPGRLGYVMRAPSGMFAPGKPG